MTQASGWLRMERDFTSYPKLQDLSVGACWKYLRSLLVGIDTDHRGLLPDWFTNPHYRCEVCWVPVEGSQGKWAPASPDTTDLYPCEHLVPSHALHDKQCQELVDAGLWVRVADTAPARYMLLDTAGCTGWNGTEDSGVNPDVAKTMFDAAYNCGRCGVELNNRYTTRLNPKNDKTIDHIIPRSRGGSDDVENLRVICRSCNSAKGARL